MTDTISNKLTNAIEGWSAPDIGPDIPHGDMPETNVINAAHIEKARIIFPGFASAEKCYGANALHAVATYAAVLGSANLKRLHCWHYLQQIGVGCYVLSGDNYPGVFRPK
ncbi:MAG: hypothetical protein ACLSBB_17425 [Ruthenibacterium lactatiformans]